MVEHQIYLELSATYLHGVLSAYKCETTPHLEKECWKVRELKRQMKSCLFQRLALSTDKAGVLSAYKCETTPHL